MSRPAQGTRTSHRPTRDGRRAREAADLKRENHHLKRTVARLRKQLDQAQTEPIDDREVLFEEAVISDPCCPSCKSKELMHVEIPGGRTITGCRPCGWRNE